MHVILLSGGAGHRLWPLTDTKHPKQYLKLLSGPKGEKHSMAQRVWRQLASAGLTDDAVVCTGREQRGFLHEQLPLATVVEEPAPRNSFPAIALSCAYLMDAMGARPDEAAVVIPIDCYVDDAYFQALSALPAVLEVSGADVVLMGKTPTAPLAKYGYILPAGRSNGYMGVAGFMEKPDEADARGLIASGALWNMGVFCLRLGLMREALAACGAPKSYGDLYRRYEKLPRISFDQQVLEHSDNLVVVPFHGLWHDIGTWDELVEVLPPTEDDSVRLIGCRETYVLNQRGIPRIVAVGTQNLVIVASDNGLLIADRACTSAIKEILPKQGNDGNAGK